MAAAIKSTQMSRDNVSSLVARGLEEAEGKKIEGNTLYKAGRHSEAATLYNEALHGLQNISVTMPTSLRPSGTGSVAPQITALTVTLRSNLAACFLAAGKYSEVAVESQVVLALDPMHVKSHYRLAKAQFSMRRSAEAIEALSVAVALSLPNNLDDDTMSFYKELAGLTMGLYFKLPPDIAAIACVASDHELGKALRHGKSVVVLKPGRYTSQANLEGPLALIGIGMVELSGSICSGAINVIRGEVHASHLKLTGRMMFSAACVDNKHAWLSMVDCVVDDYPDSAVLVCGGEAILERCSFTNIGKQAVEVREGGSMELRKCHINKCRQGIVTYGGARRLQVINCEIQNISREGVLVNGEKPNKVSRAQQLFLKEGSRNPWSPSASEWGEKMDIILEVVISSSVVKGSNYYGLSLDNGAHVTVINSVLLDNTPSACYVKGATTVLVAGCHIESRKGQHGLYVAINYGATVTASGNTFIVADRKHAIVEEMSPRFGAGKEIREIRLKMGCWSKPVTDRNNQIFVTKSSMSRSQGNSRIPLPDTPSLASLASRGIEMWGATRASQVDLHRHGSDIKVNPNQPLCAVSDNYQDLARTSRIVCRELQKAPLYYAIGNTFGYDVSLGQTLSVETHDKNVNDGQQSETIKILLGACGDIRNLLKTISCLGLQLNPHTKVLVVLNDMNIAILARNVLLLAIIIQRAPAVDIIAIWANHALTGPQSELLYGTLTNLASSLPKWLIVKGEPGCHFAKELSEAFVAWRDCTVTLEELLDQHDWSVTSNTNVFDSAVKLVANAVMQSRFDKQIVRHIQSGNVGNITKAMTRANPTLLEAPSLQYSLYWSSSIYRAIKLNADVSTSGPDALYQHLLQTITPQFDAVAEAFQRHVLQVGIVDGDILNNMLFGGFTEVLYRHEQPSQHPKAHSTNPRLACKFDFIDLSNVADYVSVPAAVQAALPLLRFVKHACLHVQSMQWLHAGKLFGNAWGLINPLAFLQRSVGMDLETYQELLGILVKVQASEPSTILYTQWTWDLDRFTKKDQTWLTGSMVLLEVISAAKLHCEVDRVSYISSAGVAKGEQGLSGRLAGLEYSSPLTLVHLLHLSCPSIFMPLMRSLVGTNSGICRKLKWELLGHAMFQKEPTSSMQTFGKLVFQTNTDFYRLLACRDMPFCLVVSKAPLVLGDDVAGTDVLQRLEAFMYSGENDRVDVIFQKALVVNPTCKSYFLTLCNVADGTKLEVVGTSVAMRDLVISEMATQGESEPKIPLWASLESLVVQPSTSPHDLELIELIAKLTGSGNVPTRIWKTHSVRETSEFVVVEILLPRPFPTVEEANLVVTSSGASMNVTTNVVLKLNQRTTKPKPQKGSKKDVAKDVKFPEHHVVSLPALVSSEGHIVKVSRELGNMVVRLPKQV